MRRLKAMLMTALLWAISWAVVGTLALGVILLVGPNPGVRLGVLAGLMLRSALYWMVWGGIAGFSFAGILAVAERRHTLEQLATVRLALWGFLGGALLPIGTAALWNIAYGVRMFGTVMPYWVVGVAGALGAVLASMQLSLARKLPAGAGESRRLRGHA